MRRDGCVGVGFDSFCRRTRIRAAASHRVHRNGGDISDRKRAEEENRKLEAQVQHAQRLQSLGILAGGLAHDFNNLLTIILGNARIALLDLPPASPVVDNLAKIETATSRAAELTSQMLAYSGKGRFTLQAVNLSRLAEETASLLQPVVSKQTNLEFNLQDSLPVIEADPAQIRQIVMNLITNCGGGHWRGGWGCQDFDRRGGCGPELSLRHVFRRRTAGGPLCVSGGLGHGMRDEPGNPGEDFRSVLHAPNSPGVDWGWRRCRHRARASRRAQGIQPTRQRLNVPLVISGAETTEQIRRGGPRRVHAGQHRAARSWWWTTNGMRNLARAILENSGLHGADSRQMAATPFGVFRRHAEEVAAVLLDLTMPVMSREEAGEMRRIRATFPSCAPAAMSMPHRGGGGRIPTIF